MEPGKKGPLQTTVPEKVFGKGRYQVGTLKGGPM